MKHVQRPNVSPPTLRNGGTAAEDTARREVTYQANSKSEEVNASFVAYWGAADVRGALWAMHGRSCAYCDRELPGNDRGDVEHFRPKNLYWWLAYRFNNYLLACSVCNSSYKGNRFPMLAPDQPLGYQERAQLDKEARALIDPTADVVDGWFDVNFDFDAARRKGFQLVVDNGLAKRDRLRSEETRDFFRLNVDSELLAARQVVIHKALKLVTKALDGDQESRDALKQIACRYFPHSFAVRRVILSHAKSPELLPSNDEELSWYVDELLELMKFASNALDLNPKNSKETDQRDRCAWALAVLMRDPPALTTEKIRTRVEAAGYLDVVMPLYDSLDDA